MSTECRLLNVLRTIEPSATSTAAVTGTKIDLFATVAEPPWSDAGTWNLDNVLTSGIVVASNDRVTTGNETGLYTAVYDDQTISTNAIRKVMLRNPLFVDGVRFSILMDMDVTTPVPAACLRMKAWQLGDAPTGKFQIDLIWDDVVVSTVDVAIPPFRLQFMQMTIDATKTVRCWLSIPTIPDITIQLSGYVPAGGRVGFALQADNQFKPSASVFRFDFTIKQPPATPVVSSDLPKRALVASANGVLYLERDDGNMAALNTPVRTLASDRLLSSVNRLNKLYIADYALLNYSASTGSNVSAVFTDSAVADWTALGVTEAVIKNDYRIEILSGTNSPTGIYDITAAGATLTLSPTPFRDGTALQYRVVRSMKVFDPGTMTLELVPLGFLPTTADGAGNPIGGPPGQFPLGATIVSLLGDRLIWTGDPLFPQVLYMSKASNIDRVTALDGANDYLYDNETEGEAYAYDATRFSGAGQIGDAVTAVIPHSLDQMIIAGYRSISIQRGDPTLGGVLDLITRDIGIIDKFAWCYTPDQNVLGMSPDGLYLFPSSADTAPLRVSRERLPRELIDIDTALFDVQMAYDIENQGANIFVTPKDVGATTHWWFDWGKKAFWPQSFQSGHEPTAVTVHTLAAQGSSLPTVIMGGRDGYLRVASNQSPTDDGEPIPSTALLGPFALGSPQFDGLLHRIWMELDSLSGAVNVDILMGDTAAKARKAIPVHSFLLSQGGDTIGPITEIVHARGGACFIRLTNNTATAWALESAVMEREVVGERRNA